MVEEKKVIPERKPSPIKPKANNLDTPDIKSVFEDQLFYDLFNARCHDTGEKPMCNLIFF